ncbi:MAG: UDP-N-acetylglucosamine 2-epimerase (non-hydrolyzing) [Methylomonas sp.]|nr:UDP-N-acetylglucosamine 2-epimerase (non-hydrolyzing) [Methylomonas sp.]PPD19766.1 MAG: UDP-N-acetylglucosamine 2-epimerase (non-hydrolyzing) [Methylomonas sp.]PPD25589.1 MAG: UDP-N-acetylglucosamine 2-epimerase (non-hydrolyzing) [Methylomonas sp.]PPD36489.1 MAG: UDP-N-acetylglucosamine 2-epimerase (non-hydrolyzing) [Methylomonas sp.]PPD40966.1 MAG: UDP-N-acetylglucosamine 2-epimerase (non-hydrolyzing) [Methylomonas sp.]
MEKQNNNAEKTLICVVGARPNFMKIAPIIKQLKNSGGGIRPYLVHTGQHYDQTMKDTFFEQLGIPEPDQDLGVGSGSHAVQTANVMLRFEPVLDEVKPFAVLVVGDVNSTIACGLVAVKKQIPVIHVEAGLRSFDRAMPEEINRILTDQLSDLLFTTERDAATNLIKEGIDPGRIHFAGNVMIDTLLANCAQATPFRTTLERYQVNLAIEDKGFALLTLHRPSNVDDAATLSRLIQVIVKIGNRLPVIFPVHPRTQQKIRDAGLFDELAANNVIVLPPVAYLEILGLMQSARFVLTDSGGLQEETTALGVPCVTLRENTERPITISEGTNTIVGTDPDQIMACVDDILLGGGKAGRVPEYWDGHAAQRIVKTLEQYFFG